MTFDRPIQTSSFTGAQVLSIMGPLGSITDPQAFAPTAVDQSIPSATSAGSGTLDSTVSVSSDGTLKVGDITVSLSIAAASDAGLTAVLIAPEWDPDLAVLRAQRPESRQHRLQRLGGELHHPGQRPLHGDLHPRLQRSATLSSLAGLSADGTWTLQITNSRTGNTSTLDTWSLNITPKITVQPVAPQSITVNGVKEMVATTFSVFFPQQQLSGTYTIQLAPGIQDQFGDATDTSQSAGLNVLRDSNQNAPTTTVQYVAQDLPKPIPSSTQTTTTGQPIPGSVFSSIVVPDSFIIEGDTTAAGASVMQVQLDLAFPDDPDLTATLYHYSPTGTLLGQVILFSNVGQGTNTANFGNTVFDDNAATPIQNGSAPFFATYDPQQSLATIFAPTTGGQQGMNVQGTWTLVLQNSSTTGTTGTFNGWSLTFQKSHPHQRPGHAGRRPQHQLPDLDPQHQRRPLERGLVAGRRGLEHRRDRPGQRHRRGSLRPHGQHGLRRRCLGRHLEDHRLPHDRPGGPTWIPLTNFGPSAAINISSIAVFPRNGDPNQSIIIAATGGFISGQQSTDAPGVGFLISQDGGATWNLYDSTVNVSGSLHPGHRQRQPAAHQLHGPRPRIRRHHGLPARRRSPALPHRPGDHLRRPERHQWRHLAQRELRARPGRRCSPATPPPSS